MDEFIKILQKALELELNGFDFYRKMSSSSKNRLVKKLFLHLAKEEKLHYQRINHIAKSLASNKRIFRKDIKLGKIEGRIFDEIFSDYEDDKEYKAEVEALKTAEKMEKGSIKHYQNALTKTNDPLIKEFLSRLIKEEEGHLISIVDSIEYLKSPEDWHQRHERSMYDGA
ncbi:MAG: ferritin family protein [Deltaproteobacteria bacterium]|nr:ferritin family protein [Deltaproteobacteria bacterium]